MSQRRAHPTQTHTHTRARGARVARTFSNFTARTPMASTFCRSKKRMSVLTASTRPHGTHTHSAHTRSARRAHTEPRGTSTHTPLTHTRCALCASARCDSLPKWNTVGCSGVATRGSVRASGDGACAWRGWRRARPCCQRRVPGRQAPPPADLRIAASSREAGRCSGARGRAAGGPAARRRMCNARRRMRAAACVCLLSVRARLPPCANSSAHVRVCVFVFVVL